MGQAFSSEAGCLPADAVNASEDTTTGVGIWLSIDSLGSASIQGMVAGGCAERSGRVKPGDHILTINGAETSEMRVDELFKNLLGQPGSVVELELVRSVAGQHHTSKVSLRRELDPSRVAKEGAPGHDTSPPGSPLAGLPPQGRRSAVMPSGGGLDFGVCCNPRSERPVKGRSAAGVVLAPRSAALVHHQAYTLHPTPYILTCIRNPEKCI